MALVQNIKHINDKRHGPQGEVECFASDFDDDEGKRYLQLDTKGSSSRLAKGATSQTIRFDENSASQLKLLIEKTFPNLR
jgi:hypothetical protein